ncbi:MAG: CapA family protein [Armatimonadetes bacterium]|nr:MAG: CapA family protein [Armatimonadota bacterium]
MAGRYPALFVALALCAAACTAAQGAPATSSAPPPSPLTTLPSTTTTTTTTLQVTTTTLYVEPIPQKTTIVINGTGDVNLDPTFVRTFPSTGYEDAWTGLFGAFLEDDLTVVNLECSPSALGSPWVKPWNFRCDPDALPSMAAAGVDIANLANNHGMDYGMEAMLDGRENLLAVGIQPVGVGANRSEAYAPVLVEINGWRVAVIGSGGVYPETGSWVATDDRPGMTSGDDTESIAAAIREAKEDADIVLVTAHWGKSYEQTPQPFEINQAKTWIDAGADGIFGHHQHHLQPLMWYEGKPIALGLGNFVWQAHPASARKTAIAQFVFEPDGHISACLVDVVIERNGHPVVQDPDAPICGTGEQHR